MPERPPNRSNAELIDYFAARLEWLARFVIALQRVGCEERPGARLIHVAIRSTVVDLARLGQADLAAAVMARARPSRPRRPSDAIRRHLGPEDVSDDTASGSPT